MDHLWSIHPAVFFFNFILSWQMRDENSVLEYAGQLVQHLFRAKAPLRGPDHQDKDSAWTIAIKG